MLRIRTSQYEVHPFYFISFVKGIEKID